MVVRAAGRAWPRLESCFFLAFMGYNVLYRADGRARHAERYMELLKESKIRGYIFQQQNYVPTE